MTDAAGFWPAIVGGFIGAVFGTCFALLVESARHYLQRLHALQALKDDARALLRRLDELDLDSVQAHVADEVLAVLTLLKSIRPRLENRPEWFGATAGTPVLEQALTFFRDARYLTLLAEHCLASGRDAEWARRSMAAVQREVAIVQESGGTLLRSASDLQESASRFEWIQSAFAGPPFQKQ